MHFNDGQWKCENGHKHLFTQYFPLECSIACHFLATTKLNQQQETRFAGASARRIIKLKISVEKRQEISDKIILHHCGSGDDKNQCLVYNNFIKTLYICPSVFYRHGIDKQQFDRLNDRKFIC